MPFGAWRKERLYDFGKAEPPLQWYSRLKFPTDDFWHHQPYNPSLLPRKGKSKDFLDSPKIPEKLLRLFPIRLLAGALGLLSLRPQSGVLPPPFRQSRLGVVGEA